MAFALHYKKAGQGVVTAGGVGIHYCFDCKNSTLSISTAHTKDVLALIDLDKAVTDYPGVFIEYFEKATQIIALVYSGNKNINLVDILEASRLAEILKTCARHVHHAILLENYEFQSLGAEFCKYYDLNALDIKKIEARTNSAGFYHARIITKYGNSAEVFAYQLDKLVLNLSEKIVADLITAEFGSTPRQYSQKLLIASTALGTIGRILNKRFNPADRIISEANLNSA